MGNRKNMSTKIGIWGDISVGGVEERSVRKLTGLEIIWEGGLKVKELWVGNQEKKEE